MESLSVTEQVDVTVCRITCDFAQEQPVRHQLGLVDGEVVSVDYHSQVIMQVQLPEQALPDFQAAMDALGCALECDNDGR